MSIQEIKVSDGSNVPFAVQALEPEDFQSLVSQKGFLEAYVVNLETGIPQVYFTTSAGDLISLPSSVSDIVTHERRVLEALRQHGTVNDVHVVEIQAKHHGEGRTIYELSVGLLSDAPPEDSPSGAEEAAKEVILGLAPEMLHNHVSIYLKGESNLYGSYMRRTGDFESYDDSRADENWTPPVLSSELEE